MVKHLSSLLFFLFFSLVLPVTAHAVEMITVESPADVPNGDLVSEWGLGVGVGVEFYRDSYIKTARLHGSDRIVVVEDEFKSQSSFWAQGHWILDAFPLKWMKPGLFVGAKLLGENGSTLDAVAVGLQLSFLDDVNVIVKGEGTPTTKKKSGWNIGFGWVNHRVQRLAKNIHNGEPLPATYDDVVIRKKSEDFWMIMISKTLF